MLKIMKKNRLCKVSVLLLFSFFFGIQSASAQDPDSSAQENGKDLAPWSKYNFVPGDKIIFQDDLVNEENGEFPSRWDILDGNAENASFNGENIINLKNKSIIMPLMDSEEYLPEVFTIEFDAYFGEKKGPFTWQYYGIRFVNKTGGWYYPDPQSKNYYYPINIYQHGAYFKASVNSISKEFETYEESLKEEGGLWRHVAIAFNKRSLKVFVDQHRVINIPNLGFQPKVFNISAWSYYDDGFTRAIKNIRVAEGGKKLYDQVMSDGKFITRGILFDVNQATIKPESMGVINEVAKMMHEHEDLSFRIEGHTDSDGEDEYNMNLSSQRAQAVKVQLVKLGIVEKRLLAKGLGESQPVAENNTAEGKANNRRVEFIKINDNDSGSSQSNASGKKNDDGQGDDQVNRIAPQENERKILYAQNSQSFKDCNKYKPSSANGGLGGSWEDPFDEDEFNFTVPDDPWGGYVEVSHGSPDPIIPTMSTNVYPNVGGTITGGSAAQSGSPRARHDVFEVAPGQSYHVLVTQFFKAPTEMYPLAYKGTWTYHSRVDCFEPNNSPDEAKSIPLNEEIEAFGIAGYKKYYIRNRDPEALDWYRFELKEEEKLKIELTQVASNQQMNIRLLGENQSVIFSISAEQGKLITHNTGNLSPGMYYLEMHPIPDKRRAYLLSGDSIPDHFDTPYKFIVKK